MRELRNTLGQTFGTKKARKAIASVTENAISPDKSARNLAANGTTKLDSASAAMLANMAEATAGMSTREQLERAVDAAKPRPKANLETKDITEVYTIDTLIGVDTMKLIPVRQWQKDMKDKKEVMVTSRFVANRLRKFADQVEKLKMLRYMLLLTDFYNATRPTRGGRSLPRRDELKTILGEMPEGVLEGVKRKFADGTMMSKFKADLLITHLCAIACVVENYDVDTWDLKEDLKLDVAGITQYFKEIGAKVTGFTETMRRQMGLEKAAAAQRRIARLKIPLEFPTARFARKK
jgi:DNA-directed RNA polymerase I subunit RPA49